MKVKIIILYSFIICIILGSAELKAQGIVINEFMASNATTVADEDGDFEDWIELYNTGENTIHLEGWGLSDDYKIPDKWIFPDTTIHAGGFLLIWASGKNRINNRLHTNFRISSQGEPIILTDNNQNIVYQIAATPLATDISFGKLPDGIGKWYYFDQPTAGKANHNHKYNELLQPPIFSHASGFYTDSFNLKVIHPDPDVTIRYTLDGSIPTVESEIFTDSLVIYNRKNEPDLISAIPTTDSDAPEWYRWFPPQETVFKGTNIRVKPFKENCLSPFTETRTYWVDDDIHSRYSLPVISISMDQNELLGSSGIYTLFNQRGPGSEREIHLAFFEPGGIKGFSTDAGIRVHGGNSRRYALKSFRIYFRNKYGDSHVDYPVFPELNSNIHERLILRNAGSDWALTYFRDPLMQSFLSGYSEVETQAYRPSLVFLNGEYWGLMNIRERFDNNYIENTYGYSEIDMLENTGAVNYGNSDHYLNLLSFLKNNSINNTENYNWLKTQMDVDDFRDYHILQVFSMNTDQPGKNVRFWRPQTSYGKWKWMWWDMDDTFVLGPHNNYDRNGLIYCIGLDSINDPNVNQRTPPPAWAPNSPTATFPLRALLENTEFRISFINRFADLLNTAFQPHYLENIIDSFDIRIGPYMTEHYKRWHRPEPTRRAEHMDKLYEFARNRQGVMYNHLQSFFDLDSLYNLDLDIGSGEGELRVNTITLNEPVFNELVYPWKGKYFRGIPIEVEAIAAPGYVFSHWEGISNQDNQDTPLLKITPDKDITLKAHFNLHEEKTLLSFWYFNDDLPNDTPLNEISPYFTIIDSAMLTFHSSLPGYPFDQMDPLWRMASMERRNKPTPLNYRPDANNNMPYNENMMRGIQIKQPFLGSAGENKLIFHLPTKNFKNILFRFAAKDEGAVEKFLVDYSFTENQENWIKTELSMDNQDVESYYNLYSFDFTHIPQANNNPHFKLRIRFEGHNMESNQNNRITFNNISLEGESDPLFSIVDREHPWNSELNISPNPIVDNTITLEKPMDIYLYSMCGNLILQKRNTDIVDISMLSAGTYIINNQHGENARVIILK